MEIITSRKNPLLQKIRQLSSGGRSVREKAGEYLGDGIKLLEEALKWDVPLTTVVVTPEVTPPALPAGVRLVQVPRDVMETISPMKTPQGALFLAQLP
ncbi:MAG: RNA methyltransferase, partial [Flintibacter sp.]|nr:RNA methyltransferase [Flintibacter sp.]